MFYVLRVLSLRHVALRLPRADGCVREEFHAREERRRACPNGSRHG